MAAKTFGKRVQSMREAKGFSASELARRSKVSSTAIHNWEQQGSIPRKAALERLSKALDVTSEYLISGSTAPVKNGATSVADVVSKAEIEVALLMGYQPGAIRLAIELVKPN